MLDAPNVGQIMTSMLEALGGGNRIDEAAVDSCPELSPAHKAALKKLALPEATYLWGMAANKRYCGFDWSAFAGLRLQIHGFRQLVMFPLHQAAIVLDK
eukprot:4775072-Alexandrium_andersonii.AAC.1